MVTNRKTTASRTPTNALPGDAKGSETAGDMGKKFDIAAELVRARTRAGLSQSQLAEKSGVSRNTLMGYESGRNKPGARELKAICEVLRVTPNKLIFGTEKPFEQKTVLDSLGIADEDLEAATYPVMLGMLARDERDAVLTLVQNLLLARHGEKFRKSMAALKGAMSVIVDSAEPLGEAFKGAMGEAALAKLGEQISGQIKAKMQAVSKPPKKRRS